MYAGEGVSGAVKRVIGHWSFEFAEGSFGHWSFYLAEGSLRPPKLCMNANLLDHFFKSEGGLVIVV